MASVWTWANRLKKNEPMVSQAPIFHCERVAVHIGHNEVPIPACDEAGPRAKEASSRRFQLAWAAFEQATARLTRHYFHTYTLALGGM
jgi:hypothetical protein